MSMETLIHNPVIIQTTEIEKNKIILGKGNDALHETIYFCGASSFEVKGDVFYAFKTFKDKHEAVRAYGDFAKEIVIDPCAPFLLLDDADYFMPFYEKSDCSPVDTFETLAGRVMVVDSCFTLEHETGAHQFLLCAEEPRDGDDSVFVSLLDGYEIYDPIDYYLGVMEDHKLPRWAKERADQLRKKYRLEEPV